MCVSRLNTIRGCMICGVKAMECVPECVNAELRAEQLVKENVRGLNTFREGRWSETQ